MCTRSDAEPRRDVLDLSAPEVCDAARVAPPSESRDSLDDDGDVAFVYSRGPYTGIQVTRADVKSLDADQQARGIRNVLPGYAIAYVKAERMDLMFFCHRLKLNTKNDKQQTDQKPMSSVSLSDKINAGIDVAQRWKRLSG